VKLAQASKIIRTIIQRHQPAIPAYILTGTKKQNKKKLKKHFKKYGNNATTGICINTTKKKYVEKLPTPATMPKSCDGSTTAMPNKPLVLNP